MGSLKTFLDDFDPRPLLKQKAFIDSFVEKKEKAKVSTKEKLHYYMLIAESGVVTFYADTGECLSFGAEGNSLPLVNINAAAFICDCLLQLSPESKDIQAIKVQLDEVKKSILKDEELIK